MYKNQTFCWPCFSDHHSSEGVVLLQFSLMDPCFICGFAIRPIDGTRASEDDVSHLVATGDILRYFPPQAPFAQVTIYAQIVILRKTWQQLKE